MKGPEDVLTVFHLLLLLVVVPRDTIQASLRVDEGFITASFSVRNQTSTISILTLTVFC